MGRKRKYEGANPAERKRKRQAAYYARNRKAILARQAEYCQRPEVRERRRLAHRKGRPIRHQRLKMDPERYAAYLERHRASDAKWRASKKKGTMQ